MMQSNPIDTVDSHDDSFFYFETFSHLQAIDDHQWSVSRLLKWKPSIDGGFVCAILSCSHRHVFFYNKQIVYAK